MIVLIVLLAVVAYFAVGVLIVAAWLRIDPKAFDCEDSADVTVGGMIATWPFIGVGWWLIGCSRLLVWCAKRLGGVSR